MSSQKQTTALKRFGKSLQAQRKRSGLTQEQLAELCEFDPTYISLLERGLRNPPLSTVVALAKHVGCKVSDLVENMS